MTWSVGRFTATSTLVPQWCLSALTSRPPSTLSITKHWSIDFWLSSALLKFHWIGFLPICPGNPSVCVGSLSSSTVMINTGVRKGQSWANLDCVIVIHHPPPPISRLINNFGISYHKYANHIQLYTALLASPQTKLIQLKMCSSEL